MDYISKSQTKGSGFRQLLFLHNLHPLSLVERFYVGFPTGTKFNMPPPETANE
jgi:hypothetical protein